MEHIDLTVEAEMEGRRLDHFLVSVRRNLSRSEIQREIRSGHVSISGRIVDQPSYRLRRGDAVAWKIPTTSPLTPRSIPLQILFEDADLVAVNKPPGLVVHPGAGTNAPTLVEGLLSHRILPRSDDPARPGIVHRLDKETSGVIVVAKTAAALTSLKRQFATRAVTKLYVAVVEQAIAEDEGWVDAPIGRDPSHPRRMTVHPQGRPAQTEFHVLQRTRNGTLLLVRPSTGRTHQIRVHMRYAGHPILGDTIYGDRTNAPRLLLHAWRLALRHPATDKETRLEAPLPPEFPNYPYEELGWGARPAR